MHQEAPMEHSKSQEINPQFIKFELHKLTVKRRNPLEKYACEYIFGGLRIHFPKSQDNDKKC